MASDRPAMENLAPLQIGHLILYHMQNFVFPKAKGLVSGERGAE